MSAAPLVTIPAGQFFGEDQLDVPLRVTFTDVADTLPDSQFFTYEIDWGDGSFPEGGFAEFMQKPAFDETNPANVEIVGRVLVPHAYATPGQYNVSVTIFDGTDQATEIAPVNVYAVDGSFVDLANPLDPDVVEGEQFELLLFPSGVVDNWRINWGNEIEDIAGNPASVFHAYDDDFDVLSAESQYNISAAVEKGGTFFYMGAIPPVARVHDVPADVTFSGPTIIEAGGEYALDIDVLNEPGDDPIVRVEIDWEFDGVPPSPADSSAFNSNPGTATHVYTEPGEYTIVAQIFDDDGNNYFDILNVTVEEPAPVDGVFLIDGTLTVLDSDAENDTVTISQADGSISVSVNDGTPSVFNASEVVDINVSLGDGHDLVVTDSNILATITINGGGGNDLLVGGGGRSVLIGGLGNDILWGAAGDDVLLGGDGDDDMFGGGGNDALVGGGGNDIVTGGSGHDLLIGSQDMDGLLGGNGEDILIGGYTIHDNDVDALDDIMAIWGSDTSFCSRVATLTTSGGLLEAGVAVFDDDVLDIILGTAGRDLVFGNTNPADGVFDILALNPIQDVLVALG